MTTHLVRRFVATAIVVLSLSGLFGTASAGAADLGTIGGNGGYSITYEIAPPRLDGVLCRSSSDTIEVFVAGAGKIWTRVWLYNHGTRQTYDKGWSEGYISGVIGKAPMRSWNYAAGTWSVYLQVGYYDTSGVFRFTYDKWVPTYGNLFGTDINDWWATPGSTCVVR